MSTRTISPNGPRCVRPVWPRRADPVRVDGPSGRLEHVQRHHRHANVWPRLEPADVLVDAMRGRSSAWYRIRLNLEHVPEADRPPQEPLEVDYDPWAGFQP